MISGWFLMHPRIVYDDLSWPLLILGKFRIHFRSGSIHWADSVIEHDRVFKMIVSGGDLQFNTASRPRWGPGILHFLKSFIFGTGEGIILWAEKSTHKSGLRSNLEPSEWKSSLTQHHQGALMIIYYYCSDTNKSAYSSPRIFLK
jgi:hypothetical protein